MLPFASGNGGAYNGGPFRGVIHTTEVKTYTPSTTIYYGHHNPSHFMIVTFNYYDINVSKYFPITVAARALANLPGGVETNRRSAIQIEIAWKAAEIDMLPEAMVERLWDSMLWVETQAGVKRWVHPKFYGPLAADPHSVARMTYQQWDAFDGWCRHQHVPENEHWDPGKLDIGRLLGIQRPGTPRCEVAAWFGGAVEDPTAWQGFSETEE